MDSVLIIKIVSALLYPLGLVSVFTVLALIYRLRGGKLGAKLLAAISVLVLFVSSSPIFATKLALGLESQYPQLKIESIPEHDAIIVLGGGLRIPLPPAQYVQLSRGSDRYWHAARLFHAGKADKIIVSGGNVYKQPGFQGEAYYASQLLQQWGVPARAIQAELDSRTTGQNQENMLGMIRDQEIRSVLLVTSAVHMPRAHYLFSRMPVSITPASADVLVREQNAPAIFSYLPSASALALTTVAVHEYYGLWFEKLKPRIL